MSYFLRGTDFAIAVLAGGAITIVNLHFLGNLIKKFFEHKKGEQKNILRCFYLISLISVKSLFFLSLVAVAIYYFRLNIVAFLIGGSVIFVALLSEDLFRNNNKISFI